LGTKLQGFLFGEAGIFLLGPGQPGKFFIPLSFKIIGNQSVFGPYQHILSPGKLGLFPSPLDLSMPDAVDLYSPSPKFLKDLEGHFQRGRCNRLQDHLANGLIQTRPRDDLARSVRCLNPSLTDIIGNRTSFTNIITNRHALTTNTTQDKSLQ
jgi:hypothetical protein